MLRFATQRCFSNDAQRKSESSALLLAFYFLKLCCIEVLKHEDFRLEETSLEVRYRVAETSKVRLKIILMNFANLRKYGGDNLEELFGWCHKG